MIIETMAVQGNTTLDSVRGRSAVSEIEVFDRQDNEFPTPSLPDDKEYHTMFSFQSEDRRWVRKIHAKLESEPYNLKCCISDRDFHAGKDVITNIEVCGYNLYLSLCSCCLSSSLSLSLSRQYTSTLFPQYTPSGSILDF